MNHAHTWTHSNAGQLGTSQWTCACGSTYDGATITEVASFDIDVLADIAGVQYLEDVDFTNGDDGPSWRIYTTHKTAHDAVVRQLRGLPHVRGMDCSDVLDKVDREDGGLFSCWIVTLRTSAA